MFKKTLLTFALIAVLVTPLVSHAALRDDLQLQLQNLRQLVASLQTQLQTMQQTQAVTDFNSCVTAGNLVMESYPRQCAHNGQTFVEVIVQEPEGQSLECPAFSRNLSYGSRGSDVSSLQRFLQSVGAYTYPVITGYYGSVTQAAVQEWQSRNGVVSSGTVMTTGFGAVGPRTQAAIQKKCGGSLPDPVMCTLQYDPVCGRTPGICVDSATGGYCTDGEIQTYGNTCQLNAAGAEFLSKGECRIETNSTAPDSCKVWNDGCNTCSRSYPGGPLACTKRACIWAGTPSCNAYFGDTTTDPELPTSNVPFSANPTYGSAPLLVTFSAPGGYSCADGPDYEINYGDGTVESTPSCTQGQQSMTHVYQSVGTFTATLQGIPSGFGGGERTPFIVSTLTITTH